MHLRGRMIEKKIFDGKNAPQIFLWKKCVSGKTYQTKWAGSQIFWLNPDE